MATSDIQICNLALSHLGNAAGQIEDFKERSTQARQCALHYAGALDTVLEAHDWDFARKRQVLAPHDEPPPDEWGFRFQYPDDCLMHRLIFNPYTSAPWPWPTIYDYGALTDQVPFDVEVDSAGETRTILTNLTPATLIYTRRIVLTTLFSATFTTALSHYLASLMAPALTGKENIQQREFKLYQGALSAAQAIDANGSKAKPPRDADWIRGRA